MNSVTIKAPMDTPQPIYVNSRNANGLLKSWFTLIIKAKLVKWEQFHEMIPLPVSFNGQQPLNDQPSRNHNLKKLLYTIFVTVYSDKYTMLVFSNAMWA